MALIKCPECEKGVSDTVENCIHCGFNLAGNKFNNAVESKTADNHFSKATQDEPKPRKGLLLAIAAAVVVVIIIIIAVNAGSMSDEERALSYAQSAVESRLASPATASFASMQESRILRNAPPAQNTFTVMSHVDSQNAMGATLRTHFTVEVELIDSSRHRIVSVNMR